MYIDLVYMKFMFLIFFIIGYYFWLNKIEGFGILVFYGNSVGYKVVKFLRKVFKDNCDI